MLPAFLRFPLRAARGLVLLAALPVLVSPLATGASIVACPAQDSGYTQTLDGAWSFKYFPALDAGADEAFHEPGFDVGSWKTIRVPSNWELQGFAEPRYATKLEDGVGLYRRTFRVPRAWRGRVVCLRFEGVAFGFKVWVNGHEIGASEASAFNRSTFDVTDALLPDAGAENVIAVRVTTKPLGWEFDVNDDWSLSGIYRGVTLFAVPQVHVRDFSTSTKLGADGSADLSLSLDASQAGAKVSGRLSAPDGSRVGEFTLTPDAQGKHFVATVHVAHPQLWTAESPSLYRLQLMLAAGGGDREGIERGVGLREVSISGGALLLNGRPIKLHGVDRHDECPEAGRAVTEADMRRDLDVMRRGNINFVRTSHYPPDERFIDLCDELGFYVMDEVPIGRGEEHLEDPAYLDNILARARATVTRDRNHASVIIWSIGNENPNTEAELKAGRLAKNLDPSRPVCIPKIGSYFGQHYEELPELVDVYAPHYPSVATVQDYANRLTRPVIFTEYAHALGLATGRIQDEWDIMQRSPRIAGGAIWHLMDQGILRYSERPITPGDDTEYVWTDAHHFYDTSGNDGTDGIVYSDRTPQTDFWETRKVYAPIQIPESSAAVEPGKREISLTVDNRYDFHSLRGSKLTWSLQRNGTAVQHGTSALGAAAHGHETVRVPVDIPSDAAGDVLTLDVACIDQTGLQINERTVRLDLPDAHRDAWLANLPAAQPTVNDTPGQVKVSLAGATLSVARATGVLTITSADGRELVSGVYPHCGRKLTMAERRSAKSTGVWRASTLTQAEDVSVTVSQQASTVILSVSARYPRPKEVEQAFVGGYRAEIAPSGVVTIHYDYTLDHAKGLLAEAGLSLVVPEGLTEFRWVGQGPYAGYPGKDRLTELGLYHLNRDDLRFQGNRRGTELALFTTPAGAGIALVSDPADIAVERSGDETLLSQNAVISGLGNKGVPPETMVESDKLAHISGTFTLVPLADKWPAALLARFGKPAPAKDVFRPYYWSYDQ